MEGHELLGFGFFMVGLWHLFNHIKLHALSSKSYTSTLWFPTRKCKYLELYFIMASCTIFIAMELFISPAHHQPFDPDGSIPSYHLHNFEHSLMSLTFLVYATFAIVLDRKKGTKVLQHELTHFLGGMTFTQQLLLIHLHSRDHKGIEGQYHLLLQLVVLVCLVTTLMGIGMPKSFLVSFVRSVSIIFQGVWLMVMGLMLWTPGYEPKGCFLEENQNYMIKCRDDEALHRAISLVNILFSWLLIVVIVFAMSLYLIMVSCYGEKVEYVSLRKEEHCHEEYGSNNDVESQYQKERMQEQT